MKQLQAKINGKWHEVCCVELHNEAKSLIGSFAVDGGYIEFRDQENQEKCMALIKDLVATAHQQGAEEERETMKKLIHEAIWAEKETINGRIIEFSEKRLLEIFGYNGKPLTERETE